MSKKPNILMVLSDQHNAGLLGCAGHSQAITPNLDRLAAEGMRFSNAYTQNTICTPSRVSILSGQYCHNHGYYGLSGPAPSGLDNLMRHCRRFGYRTAAFGKLHLPNRPRNWLSDDLDRFGDTYETADGVIGESEFFRYLDELGLRDKEDSWHNTKDYGEKSIARDARPSKLPYEHTQEVWCARQAMRFMEAADSDQPFCIQVSFQKPHHPLLPNERFWNMYDENLELPATVSLEPGHRPPHFQTGFQAFQTQEWDYKDLGDSWESGVRRAWRGTLACISQVDDVLGMLLNHLAENGLAENTIVVYGSDHGSYHGMHGIIEKAPGICSNEVCRVPLIWRGPGISAGTSTEQLIENIDIAPTLTSLCGLPPLESADGLDAAALLAGEDTPLHELAVTENAWSKALRWGKWRYVHYQREMFNEDVGELYDIAADPEERCNLYHAPEFRETVQECRRLLLEWLIRTTRVVTTHPADKTPVPRPSDGRGENISEGQIYEYPLASDGRAPNPSQPRFKKQINKNYI